MPNNIDIYSTHVMLRAIELMPREYRFFEDMFVYNGGTVEDEEAIFDVRKGIQQMAPFVVPYTGGVPMKRNGFETRRIGFPTIAPERVVDIRDLTARMFGEAVFGAMTPEQRSKKIQARDLMELRAAIQRRTEWMAREVMLTGKLEIFRYTNEGRDKETTMVADFGFTNKFVPDTAWDQAGAKIVDDMMAIYDLVYDGLGQVDIMVMAPDVAAAILNNEAYMKNMDMRNVDMGDIKTKYRGQGVRFIGRNADGVEMYSHSGKFVNDQGNTEAMMPSGTLIAGSKGLLKKLYGPVTLVEGTGAAGNHRTYIKPEVPQRLSDENSGAIKNRITSRPIIMPDNVDAWCVANVLG